MSGEVLAIKFHYYIVYSTSEMGTGWELCVSFVWVEVPLSSHDKKHCGVLRNSHPCRVKGDPAKGETDLQVLIWILAFGSSERS